jgi:hypothetical protein
MLRSRSRGCGWAVLGALVIGPLTASGNAAPLDRETVRKTLKQAWDSLETVQFRDEEFGLDASGAPDRSNGFTRIDFALGSGGRRSVVITAVRPTGEESVFDLHEDGRRSLGAVPHHAAVAQATD